MKRIKYLLIGVFLFIIGSSSVYAGSWASIGGNSSVTKGNSIDVSGTVSADSALFFVEGTLKCNGAGVSKSIDLNWDNMDNSKKSNTKYMNITPTGTGTITCTINGRATGAGWTGWQNVSASKQISVNKPREKSTNNNLKSLSVEGYELKPAFDKDTLEYTVEVTDNAEKIKINAEKADGYASLSGDGEIEVAEGINNLEVKVTSETGNEKVYKLTVTVKDNNPIKEKVDGSNYTVVKRAKSLVLPDALDKEAFTESKVKLGENEIPAYTSEKYKLTLIGLTDEKGNIYLYTYENGKVGKKYELLTSKGLTVLFSEAKKVPTGFIKTTVKINGKEYTAYKNEKKDYDFVLVYGSNIETKEDKWYSYNLKENTLQSYDTDLIDDLNKEHKAELDNYKMYMFVLGSISGLLLVIIIILLITRKKGPKKPKEDKNISNFEEDLNPENIEKELETTKEIDTTEIIIDKPEPVVIDEDKAPTATLVKIEAPVEEENKESKKEKKKHKKEKKQEPTNNSEFLNTEDLKEILDNEPLQKEVEKIKEEAKVNADNKTNLEETEEMDLEFLNDFKGRKKKKR